MKRTSLIAALVMLTMLFGAVSVDASSISINSMNAEDGIVTVSYAGVTAKTKVMVEKDSARYFYDLKNEEDSFPLQLGDGKYTVAVLENISGTSYRILTQKSFNADITEDNSVYLNSVQPVLWNEDMKAIKLAASLTEDIEGDSAKAKVIFDYIVNNISYDYDKISGLSTDYTPDIDAILSEGKGICYDYAVLYAAMLRSQGIPAKLVKGYRSDLKAYHAWNEVYLDGGWKVIDTTYSAALYKARLTAAMFENEEQYSKSKEY
ncbi:MAG: transglutaminase-like domain-containing protein [Pseudomonadota bacterium]